MTTLANRPNTALVVIDVQNGIVTGTHDRDAVVANIAALVKKARSEQVPVVWVQHQDEKNLPHGSDGWLIVPELSPSDTEPLVPKTYADSFEDTTLENVLANLGIGRLVVTGAQTDECIRSTLHGAIARGYDATLVSDAHTTEDQSEWAHQHRTRSSLTRTSTGATTGLRAVRQARWRPRMSTSAAPPEARVDPTA